MVSVDIMVIPFYPTQYPKLRTFQSIDIIHVWCANRKNDVLYLLSCTINIPKLQGIALDYEKKRQISILYSGMGKSIQSRFERGPTDANMNLSVSNSSQSEPGLSLPCIWTVPLRRRHTDSLRWNAAATDAYLNLLHMRRSRDSKEDIRFDDPLIFELISRFHRIIIE